MIVKRVKHLEALQPEKPKGKTAVLKSWVANIDSKARLQPP